jgi:hypothetical protein
VDITVPEPVAEPAPDMTEAPEPPEPREAAGTTGA